MDRKDKTWVESYPLARFEIHGLAGTERELINSATAAHVEVSPLKPSFLLVPGVGEPNTFLCDHWVGLVTPELNYLSFSLKAASGYALEALSLGFTHISDRSGTNVHVTYVLEANSISNPTTVSFLSFASESPWFTYLPLNTTTPRLDISIDLPKNLSTDDSTKWGFSDRAGGHPVVVMGWVRPLPAG